MIILVDKIFSKCCCDYYDQRKTAALNPEKIGVASKCAGIDPKIVFKNLYVHPAYNIINRGRHSMYNYTITKL